MKRSLLRFFRSIKNHPGLFSINLLGYTIGLMAVLFIFLFVSKELKTDRFHKNHKDIYRVITNIRGRDLKSTATFYPLGDLLQNHFPEIEGYIRYDEEEGYIVSTGINQFINQTISFVDPSFFEILDFRLQAGDYNMLINNPNGVVLTPEYADKLFGDISCLGEELEVSFPGSQAERYTVIGILEEYPEESTLRPHIIANIQKEEIKNYNSRWRMFGPQLFLYMPGCNHPDKIASGISKVVADERNNAYPGFNKEADPDEYELQSLDDVFLHSLDIDDGMAKGNPRLLKILIIIGLTTLLIASMNYIILSVGINSKNKFYGQIHTIFGAKRIRLLGKVMSDSIIFSILAFVVLMVAYPFAYKALIYTSNYPYGLFTSTDVLLFSSFFIIVLVFGMIGGYLEYLFLSKFIGFKLIQQRINRRQHLFRSLIQVQLLIFIVFMIGLFVINKQIAFIRNSDKGCDLENAYSFTMPGDNDLVLFVQEFKNKAYIGDISRGENLFRNEYNTNEIGVDGSETKIEAQCFIGDHNYLDVYDIKLISGRNLDEENYITLETLISSNWSDRQGSEVLVNEEFIKRTGLKDPLGVKVTGLIEGEIVGIINDVRNLPLYYSQKPVIIGSSKYLTPRNVIVSVDQKNVSQLFRDVNDFYESRGLAGYSDLLTWKFDFKQIYNSEQALNMLINVFSLIVFGILVLGLTGLSLYISENRIKEIGIRKVNGARVSEVMSMLNKNFVRWVGIAFVIATPIAYYAMNKWLQNFAYKISLSWWIFALAGLLALGIALLTVSWQSYRAASRNPVEALRYE